MRLSYKYRMHLNPAQIRVMDRNLYFQNFVFNNCLEERISYYQRYGKGLSYYDQAALLKEIRKVYTEYTYSIYSQSLQEIMMRLERSYKNFFRRLQKGEKKAGFPRWKSLSRMRSTVFPQCDLTKGGVKLLENQRLKIFGMPGEVRVEWHRPFQGRCKQVILLKQGRKFYIILSCDEVPLAPLPPTGRTVALDLGISTFITTDDGTQFHHPKPYKTAKEKLAFLQRRLAAKQKGSKNRQRAKSQLARAYEKVTNVRDDFLHKITKKLVAENDVIIIEKLNVKGMLEEQKGFEVRKDNIQDASWGRFATLLSYKAERAGRKVIEVDPRNTSRMCSCCGTVKESLSLQERLYHCSACGSTMDRDVNAAINIKRKGLGMSLEDGTKSSIPEAISFS